MKAVHAVAQIDVSGPRHYLFQNNSDSLKQKVVDISILGFKDFHTS
jgi:hypothetical protein